MRRGTAFFIESFLLLSSVVIVDTAFGADFDLGLQAYKAGNFGKAADEWQPLAEQGASHAQFNMGLMYAKGQGVGQDYAKAAEFYRKSAEQGCATAQFNLGVLYVNGQGVPKDAAEATQWFKKAAAQGDFNAATNLATIYEERKDSGAALEWVTKAASAGNADAMFQLGFFYDTGKGVEQSFSEARNWYEKAAEQGVPAALCNLAILYYNGEGVSPNRVTAHQYFLLARDFGEPRASNLIGLTTERLNKKQIAQAVNLASEWHEAHPVKPAGSLVPPDERVVTTSDAAAPSSRLQTASIQE